MLALGWGRRWRTGRRRRKRSGASRRQRRRPGWGDGAGARVRRGAAPLRGAQSGVRSAAASLPGAAGGREDAEQVDERQQQEPGARVQLHRAAAGRQRVHLHHPGQCRAAPPAGPLRLPSLANLALSCGRCPESPQTPALCPPLATEDGPVAGRLLPNPCPWPGTGRFCAAAGRVAAFRIPNSFPALPRGKGASSWLLEPARVGGIVRGRPEGGGQGWRLLPRPPRRGAQALALRPSKDG